jgi:hypothetical protein
MKPRAVVLLKGLGKWDSKMMSSELEPATLRRVLHSPEAFYTILRRFFCCHFHAKWANYRATVIAHDGLGERCKGITILLPRYLIRTPPMLYSVVCVCVSVISVLEPWTRWLSSNRTRRLHLRHGDPVIRSSTRAGGGDNYAILFPLPTRASNGCAPLRPSVARVSVFTTS